MAGVRLEAFADERGEHGPEGPSDHDVADCRDCRRSARLVDDHPDKRSCEQYDVGDPVQLHLAGEVGDDTAESDAEADEQADEEQVRSSAKLVEPVTPVRGARAILFGHELLSAAGDEDFSHSIITIFMYTE